MKLMLLPTSAAPFSLHKNPVAKQVDMKLSLPCTAQKGLKAEGGWLCSEQQDQDDRNINTAGNRQLLYKSNILRD